MYPAGEGAVPPRTLTDGRALAIDDSGLLIEIDSATAVTITVPPEATVPFPVGTRVDIIQVSGGQVTVAAGDGVTVRTAETLLLAGQWAAASLYKRAAEEWVLIGNLEAA